MNKKSDAFFAFVAGVVAGAALGILFAPDKGSNTRDKLSFQLDKYRHKLKEIIDQLMEEHEHPSSVARAEGQKIINDAKLKAESLLADVDNLIDQIKSKSSNQG
jgi:gas vesicle protein